MLTPSRYRQASRVAVIAALAGIAAVGWWRLLTQSPGGLVVCTADGPKIFISAWDIGRAGNLWAMWSAMISATAPLAVAGPAFRQVSRGESIAEVANYVAPCLCALMAFAGVVAIVQWALESLGVLHGGTGFADPTVGAEILALLGAFMLLRFRTTTNCSYRLADGQLCGITAGLSHARASLECCGVMVAVQFSSGAMSFFGVVAMGLWMFVELELPWPRFRRAATGATLFSLSAFIAARDAFHIG